MSYRIEYAEKALTDLDEIYGYIAFSLCSPQTAANVYKRIVSRIRSLDSLPFRNALVAEEPWRGRGLRKPVAGNYAVFYTADEAVNTVRIIRILYGGRDIGAHLSDTAE